jgi:PadR family transcriptional regulator AphA
MSLKHALLGLLSEREGTGYDLTRMFEISMSHYWHAGHSQIYPLLDQMEKDGLIAFQHVVQKEKPNKKIYRITPRGREDLVSWLRVSPRPPRYKDESLLRVRFFRNLPETEAIALLLARRREHQATLDEYRKLEATYFPKMADANPNGRGNLYAYFTLQRGIMLERDSIRWCRWAISQLRARQGKSRGKNGESEEA